MDVNVNLHLKAGCQCDGRRLGAPFGYFQKTLAPSERPDVTDELALDHWMCCLAPEPQRRPRRERGEGGADERIRTAAYL